MVEIDLMDLPELPRNDLNGGASHTLRADMPYMSVNLFSLRALGLYPFFCNSVVPFGPHCCSFNSTEHGFHNDIGTNHSYVYAYTRQLACSLGTRLALLVVWE